MSTQIQITPSSANFANTDLTFTGTRTHDTAGNALNVFVDTTDYDKGFFDVGPLGSTFGYNQTFHRYGSLSLQTYVNGTAIMVANQTSVGIGATIPGARLDVRAQGALSTDVAFRVRNSTDFDNLIEILGDRNINVGQTSAGLNSTFNVRSGFGGGNFIKLINNSSSYNVYHGLEMISTGRPGYFALQTAGNQGSSITRFRGGGSSAANAKTTAIIRHPGDTDLTGHWHFRTQVLLGNADRDFQTNYGRHTFIVENGTIPSVNCTDGFIQYSADITAGNAAPHFRTENGSIIKLYQQPSAGIATVADIVTVLTNLGLLA